VQDVQGAGASWKTKRRMTMLEFSRNGSERSKMANFCENGGLKGVKDIGGMRGSYTRRRTMVSRQRSSGRDCVILGCPTLVALH